MISILAGILFFPSLLMTVVSVGVIFADQMKDSPNGMTSKDWKLLLVLLLTMLSTGTYLFGVF